MWASRFQSTRMSLGVNWEICISKYDKILRWVEGRIDSCSTAAFSTESERVDESFALDDDDDEDEGEDEEEGEGDVDDEEEDDDDGR